jgi:DNA-binding NarL/FixJ family response regulator
MTQFHGEIMDSANRILIVEDHELFRFALREVLSTEPDMEIVGELDNAQYVIQTIKETSPHLVLMDLMMPGTSGIEGIKKIARRFPRVKVLVITAYKLEEYVTASLNAGAFGYVAKDSHVAELRLAVRSVLHGKFYVSSGIAGQVVAGYLAGGAQAEIDTPWHKVTHRERQVLKLIAEGHSSKFIAEYLCISANTVKTHRSNLIAKLDLHNAAELTAFAIGRGLLAPKDNWAEDNSRFVYKSTPPKNQ